MKTEFIPKFVMLLAGAIVCIISIVRDMDVTYSLEVLLATLIIFYLIGCIAKMIIEKVKTSNRFIRQRRDEEIQEAQEQLKTEENTESAEDEPTEKE